VLDNVSLVLQGRGGGILESDDIVANLHVGNALTDRLNDTGALVTEDNGECALGVLSGQCVGICGVLVYPCLHLATLCGNVELMLSVPVWQTPV
jgi:hypothetical protein